MGYFVKRETIRIGCGDVKLYGELYIPEIIPASALLICHGMNVRGFHFLKTYTQLAETACREGFVSLVFDFRGCGKSTGKFDYGFGEQQDVKCALDYLSSRPEVLPSKIFIVSHSLGGAISLYAIQKQAQVRGLVLWSVPKNHNYNVKKFITITRGKLGLYLFFLFSWIDKFFDASKFYKLKVYGINLRLKHVKEKLMKLNECEAVTKLDNVPLLVVVGDKDAIVGVDEAREVFMSAHEPKRFLIVEGADHIYSEKEDELITKTIDWIKQWKKNGASLRLF
jgi:alpha/beta superfamily hydrolase